MKNYCFLFFFCCFFLPFTHRAQNPQLLKDIRPGDVGGFQYTFFGSYNPYNFNVVWEHDGFMYFKAIDNSTTPTQTGATGTNNYELWRSDGTPAGTSLVKDIYPGLSGSDPEYFSVFNNELYFIADDGTHGKELWKTDGTEAGTVMVKDINPGSGSGFRTATTSSIADITFWVAW